MSVNIKRLRDQYQQVCTKINNKQYDKTLVKLIKQSKQTAQKQRQTMIQKQSYQYLQQTNFYIDKYAQEELIMQKQRDKIITSSQFVQESKQLFSGLPPGVITTTPTFGLINPTSTIQPNVQKSQSFQRDISPQRLALSNFFNKKNTQVQPNTNFREMFDSPNVSPRNFRKKIRQDNSEVQSLISQNDLLRSKIQQLGSRANQSAQLQTRYRQNLYEIQSLQKQNTRLLRDNAQLRSERSVTYVTNKNSSNFNPQNDDPLYSPYTFNVMNNDMYKINLRNYRQQMTHIGGDQKIANRDQIQSQQSQQSQYIPVQVPKKNIVYKKVGYQYENYTQQDYRQERANVNYSIFDPNRSVYSQQDMNSSSYLPSKGIQNSQIALRNKLAFFRQKSLILKNSDIEVGYKRSSPQNGDTVRVILYFNNKNADYKIIKIQYKYEQDFYQITVNQKIRELDSFRQGRQVVQVKLRPGAKDLNSIIDVIVTVGPDKYNLWLPAMFISEGQGPKTSTQQINSKDIHPVKAFSSPNEAIKIIQSLKIINTHQAQFWCSSCKGSGLVNLLWKLDKNRLKIKCDEKWLHFFAFLMNQNS